MSRVADRPNVMLIVFDTARADAFEPYGAGSGATPAVAQLARRGHALPAAYSTSNWTLPAHVSMFSGLLPRATGLTQAPGGKAINCRPYVEALKDRWLPVVLRNAGYDTRAASANAWISHATGFGSGFNEFHDVWSQRSGRVDDKRIRGRVHWLLEGARSDSDDGAAQVESLVARWLDDEASRPFFWFVNLVECHSPYLPPKPYNDMRLRARLKSGADVRRYQGLVGVWRTCAVRDPIPADALARMRHLYGRSIRSMDDWLGRVLERLDASGVLDDTIVIVTSDHGENLGESNLIGHSFSLDQRLIRVPWIVAGPGIGRRDETTSLAAFSAIVAEAVGLTEHPWPAAGDAVVVSQYDRLAQIDDPRIQEFKARYGLNDDAVGWFSADGTAATDGMLKLVREKNEERAYDLRADPLERSPLPPGAVDGAFDRLRAALNEAEHQRPVVRPVTEGQPVNQPDVERENAELEERLRLLGYLE